MSFVLTITTAGLDALVNAQSAATEAVRITQVGFSAQPFNPAPTLTALPGEFKRIGAISGTVLSPNVIHMTAQDSSADVYDMRSFALYLEDGTLFAFYQQATPIISKAAVLNLQLAFDIVFQDTFAGDIEFGDATFLFPPATETVRGVAEIATQAEVDAGADDERFVTPLKLAAFINAAISGAINGVGSATELAQGLIELATQAETTAGTDDARAVTPLKLAQRLAPVIQSIANEAAARVAAINGEASTRAAQIAAETSARQSSDASLGASISALVNRSITGAGLASGGGSLSADRVINVAAATIAQFLAGSASNVALTPGVFGPVIKVFGQNGYIALALGEPGNAFCIQWGRFVAGANTATNVSFPVAFQQCFIALVDGVGTGGVNDQDNYPAIRSNSISAVGFQAWSARDLSEPCTFIAIGSISL